MQFFRSPGEESLANMEIMSSAGRRETGDRRHRSSIARRSASSSESGDTEGAREDCESLPWYMRESLSSSSGPRSGEVEAEVSEREALTSRSWRRERAMVVCGGCASGAWVRWGLAGLVRARCWRRRREVIRGVNSGKAGQEIAQVVKQQEAVAGVAATVTGRAYVTITLGRPQVLPG